MQYGVRIDDPELGLAALEFSRTALRGVCCRLVIEVEEEPDILASIDAIRDVTDPTAEERRNAIVHEDILHRIRKHVSKLQRALVLLLTQQELADPFGYRDQLFAEAIRRLSAPHFQSRDPGDIALDAWPTYDMEQPTIRFDVPRGIMDEFYAKDSFNSAAIRMGDAGGCVVGDLHPNAVATRFLPILAERLIDFADVRGLPDERALATIGVQPSMWRMGLA